MSIAPTDLDVLPKPKPTNGLLGGDGPGFGDLVDVVNPLHHLPVVGPIYRATTTDEIGYLPRMLGSLLFGGPIGLAAAIVDVGVEAGTGKSLGDHALAEARAFFGSSTATAATKVQREATQVLGGLPDALPGRPPLAVPEPPISGARERLLAEIERRTTFADVGKTDLVS